MTHRWSCAVLAMALAHGACSAPARVAAPVGSRPAASASVADASQAGQAPHIVSGYGYRVELVDQTGDTEHGEELVSWLSRAQQSIAETTGGASRLLRVVAKPGEQNGSTKGSVITMKLRAGPRPPSSSTEWVLHHELIHASYPSLAEEDLWLEEGLATYLEPLARVRAQQLAASSVWHDWARDMPQGAARAGEAGLRGTRTWHRLYWQGAVFWLQAELEIDRRTSSSRSLHDALCAWARAGADGSDWSAERAFTVMDAALGQPILLDLYRQASTEGIKADPNRLLAELGVSKVGEAAVTLSNAAPAAALRQRMTEPQARPCSRGDVTAP